MFPINGLKFYKFDGHDSTIFYIPSQLIIDSKGIVSRHDLDLQNHAVIDGKPYKISSNAFGYTLNDSHKLKPQIHKLYLIRKGHDDNIFPISFLDSYDWGDKKSGDGAVIIFVPSQLIIFEADKIQSGNVKIGNPTAGFDTYVYTVNKDGGDFTVTLTDSNDVEKTYDLTMTMGTEWEWCFSKCAKSVDISHDIADVPKKSHHGWIVGFGFLIFVIVCILLVICINNNNKIFVIHHGNHFISTVHSRK